MVRAMSGAAKFCLHAFQLLSQGSRKLKTPLSPRGFSDLATALSVVLRNRQKLKKSISIKVTYLLGKNLALNTLLAIFISSIEIPNIVRSEYSPCS